jgi:hypothetical protein
MMRVVFAHVESVWSFHRPIIFLLLVELTVFYCGQCFHHHSKGSFGPFRLLMLSH